MGAKHSVAGTPTLLGVINLSPESLVADSVVHSEAQLLDRAAWLTDHAVELLDVGGRSITPGVPEVDDAEEQARLEPAVRLLAERGYRISVDTWSDETAQQALAWGASFVNYTREELSDTLLEAIGHAGATLCLTYMPSGDAYRMRSARRRPTRMQDVVDFMGPRVERARAAGVEELVLDPNVGILHAGNDDFQKIHLQLHLLDRIDELRSLGCPLMLYAARKPERLARIMMASSVLRARPDYLRTHEPDLIEGLWRAELETSR